jgi:copper chaperone CopZ
MPKETKIVYKVKGLDCAACAKMLEMDLEEAGITAKCDYAKETLEVKSSDLSKIKAITEAAGYSLASEN